MPKLSPVPQGTPWPSGDYAEIAVLPLTADELSARIGLPLITGTEAGLGPWSAAGGRLPSGSPVELVCYNSKPKSVVLHADKTANLPAVLDEVLTLLGFSRSEVFVSLPGEA